MDSIIQSSANGLTIGVIYSLISVACSLGYGAARPLIFASGAVYLIGAAVSASVVSVAAMYRLDSRPLDLVIALIAALTIGLIAGWAIGRCVHNQSSKQPALLPLAASAGFFMLAAGLLQLIGQLHFPQLPNAQFALRFVPETNIVPAKPIAFVLGAIALAAVLYVIRNSSFGRAQRAIMQDRQTAELLGLDLRWAGSMSILLASAIAVLAGWMTVISQGPVDLNSGLLTIASVFCAATAGGLRSPRRVATAGFLTGLANALWSLYFGAAYAGIAIFALLVFILTTMQPALIGRRPAEKA